jgi:hypothetical protein
MRGKGIKKFTPKSMVKGQNLTEYQKIRIGECYNREYSPTMVAKVLGRPVSTITAIYSRFVDEFCLPSK